jgi:hypothetical protein
LVFGARGIQAGDSQKPECDPKKNADEAHEIKRRILVAVPDLHSRKPNLRELIERIFFSSSETGTRGNPEQGKRCCEYSAMEVFARNLTAGWWACGDEVLRFNWAEWWRIDS